jgi:hypothetical protein
MLIKMTVMTYLEGNHDIVFLNRPPLVSIGIYVSDAIQTTIKTIEPKIMDEKQQDG